MNAHVDGVIFKDTLDARIRQPQPPQKPQRRPLGLAPAEKDISIPSALDGRSVDELASPATVQHVLEALDAAIAVRSDLDAPLHVRLSRVESDNGELRTELVMAKAEVAALKAAFAKAETAMNALRASAAEQARKAAVAAKAASEAKLARVLAKAAERAEQKAAQP